MEKIEQKKRKKKNLMVKINIPNLNEFESKEEKKIAHSQKIYRNKIQCKCNLIKMEIDKIEYIQLIYPTQKKNDLLEIL